MSDKLEDLGWPEAKLSNIVFNGEILQFSMIDLLSYDDPLKFEVVDVNITEIDALRIDISPYDGAKYLAKETVVNVGHITDEDEGFEGIIEENPFSESKAKYFWISGDVNAKSIQVTRTGKYEYIPRTSKL